MIGSTACCLSRRLFTWCLVFCHRLCNTHDPHSTTEWVILLIGSESRRITVLFRIKRRKGMSALGILKISGVTMDTIVLLGSTGSIGKQTLEVCKAHNIAVRALSANSNVELLEQQTREFMPEYAVIADDSLFGDLKQRLSDTNVKVLAGEKGLCEVAALPGCKIVNAIVGMAGLVPTQWKD